MAPIIFILASRVVVGIGSIATKKTFDKGGSWHKCLSSQNDPVGDIFLLKPCGNDNLFILLKEAQGFELLAIAVVFVLFI
jgi:hypothetical protein